MTDLDRETITPAPNELTALAARMRPDWDRQAFTDALTAARTAMWPWDQTCRLVFRMLLDPRAEPRDLRNAARSPIRRQEPGDEKGGAALARELLEQRLRGEVA
jgi:hypothetical protein